MSADPPTAPAKYVEQKLSFPQEDDPQAPIHAKEAGMYKLTITVITKNFEKPYEVRIEELWLLNDDHHISFIQLLVLFDLRMTDWLSKIDC